MDGRVLNFLTVDDLFQLKVTNQLHHLSLRRGIQVIGLLSFHNILCLLGFTGKQLPAKLPQEKRRARRKRESGGRREDLLQNICLLKLKHNLCRWCTVTLSSGQITGKFCCLTLFHVYHKLSFNPPLSPSSPASPHLPQAICPGTKALCPPRQMSQVTTSCPPSPNPAFLTQGDGVAAAC